MAQGTARLDPLPPEHSPELKDQFASFFKSLGFVPNSVLTMQRDPKLVHAFVTLQGAIWGPDSKVDRGLKRLIAHVASRSAGDAYSMAHTASGALHFGVAPEKLAAVSDFAASALFTPAEKAALAIANAAGRDAVTDDMFAHLRTHWSDVDIVEIVAAIAATGFVNRWNATMATPLEDEPMQAGHDHLAASGWTPGAHQPD
ncbi:MAG: carboxymuconolactone decarboxylase family protein [Xanthobacteraceae bacterium]